MLFKHIPIRSGSLLSDPAGCSFLRRPAIEPNFERECFDLVFAACFDTIAEIPDAARIAYIDSIRGEERRYDANDPIPETI